MSARRMWFHPKRYGWGWGMPATWEGWCVFVGYLLILPAGLLLGNVEELQTWLYWLVWVFGWTGLLIVICYRTGPRPRWRWGDQVSRPYGWPKLCEECEYDLTGNTSGACPECGCAIPAEQIEALRGGEPGSDHRVAESGSKGMRE